MRAFSLFGIVSFAVLIASACKVHAGVIFSDDFDTNSSLANWVGIEGLPIPNYIGPIQEFGLSHVSSRSVALARSLMPVRSSRGLWTVQSFASQDIKLEAVFSPISGIDGIFNLQVLGDNGYGFAFRAGVFGAGYGAYRFGDSIQGWGLPRGDSGYLRKASGDDDQALDWTWDYGEWYHMSIGIDEFTTKVTIRSESVPSDSWEANFAQGHAWLGNSFRIGMVQTMFIPEPASNLWETNAMIDRVTLSCVPEPTSMVVFGALFLVGLGVRRKRSASRVLVSV